MPEVRAPATFILRLIDPNLAHRCKSLRVKPPAEHLTIGRRDFTRAQSRLEDRHCVAGAGARRLQPLRRRHLRHPGFLGGQHDYFKPDGILRGTEPAKLSALMKGELDWIVMKALEKDRARRYQTANGLARDLQRYLANEPVEAGPSMRDTGAPR